MASHRLYNKIMFKEMTLFEDLFFTAVPGEKCRHWSGRQGAPSP